MQTLLVCEAGFLAREVSWLSMTQKRSGHCGELVVSSKALGEPERENADN
jgi:hypothetical protein